MTKILTGAVAVILSIVLGAGCAPRTEPSPAGWPQDYKNFTIVWTGEKGLDLVTGPAVAVRAYIESFFLVELTGDDKYLYPGFATAVADEWRPGTADPADDPWVGTLTNRLLSLTRNDSTVTAIGCMYTYGAASPDGKGEYASRGVPIGSPEGGINAFKVTLSANSGSGQSGKPQEGPERTPFDDVFGGYQIDGYWGGYISAKNKDGWDWPERQEATDECVAKAPDPFERRKYLLENFLPQSEFYPLPVKPGWPARPENAG
ncbi:hypothetical protein JNN96_37860 [Mycobacterium sp. DSM 3803]|nr:hypothetical protein [Mycobacterium sp. DSM 3803]